jgi:hypothetical protein
MAPRMLSRSEYEIDQSDDEHIRPHLNGKRSTEDVIGKELEHHPDRSPKRVKKHGHPKQLHVGTN